ncbi:hypothetical protein [Salipaludibacillus sp. CF4.18]|uniref:hypothetical protein n=1 Tax=Salipaludibacillus sp. CF4.18 TaxID=3373081 RepID=UPI003EE534CD
MNINQSILDCLENHPGASSNKILKLINESAHHQSIIFKKLRTLKRDRKVINKGNSWYLIK